MRVKVLTWSLLLATSTARAQTAEVQGLVRAGLDLRRERRDEEALAAFQRAWELSHGPRERAQMGFAEQALGRWTDADTHLREALSASTDPWVAERREVIEEALREVDAHLGTLEVRGNVPGAEVRLDGRVVGALPFARPVRVGVGRVAMEVVAPQRVTVRREVRVRARELTRETVELAPAASPAPRAGMSGARVMAWVAAGGAAVGLGVGVAGLLLRNDAASRWNSDACLVGGRTRRDNCAAELAAGERNELMTGVGFGVGGALAVTSAVLFLTMPAGRSTGMARLVCGPGPGSIGVACGGAL